MLTTSRALQLCVNKQNTKTAVNNKYCQFKKEFESILVYSTQLMTKQDLETFNLIPL